MSIKGHRTSYSLESEFQIELEKLAKSENISMAKLITKIDIARAENNNLSSALRLHVLKKLQERLSA